MRGEEDTVVTGPGPRERGTTGKGGKPLVITVDIGYAAVAAAVQVIHDRVHGSVVVDGHPRRLGDGVVLADAHEGVLLAHESGQFRVIPEHAQDDRAIDMLEPAGASCVDAAPAVGLLGRGEQHEVLPVVRRAHLDAHEELMEVLVGARREHRFVGEHTDESAAAPAQ